MGIAATFFTLGDGTQVPYHSIVDKDKQQRLGVTIPQEAYFVLSGSINVSGSTTGSVPFSIDSYLFKVKRVEIFHSGAASQFSFTIENKETNLDGATFDPLAVVAEFSNVPGSNAFADGIDDIGDLVGITGSSGSLWVKIKPYEAGNNSFKYLMFFEPKLLFTKQL